MTAGRNQTALGSAFTSTGALLRLVLRRDRVVLASWVLLVVAVGAGTTAYYLDLLDTAVARAALARDVERTPALLAFNGELYDTGIGVMATWRMRDLSYVLIGLMAVLTVVRHTRVEEESGRQELVGAAVVGRYAPLTAALLVGLGACVSTAALNGLSMLALGLDPVGSAAYLFSAAATGAVFTVVGALVAQLATSGRSAVGAAVTVLGASYVVRFVADGSGLYWLKWFTPLGWAHLMRPFADERWAVALVPVLAATVLVVAAYAVVTRRDLGAGLRPARPGPASGRLGSPLALAWRLQRGLLIGWVAAFAFAGALFAQLVAAAGSTSVVVESPQMQTFVERYTDGAGVGTVDTFLWVIALSLGYTAALYPALAVLRLRAEESSGRAESLLAAPVDRRRWVGGHLLVATLGTVAVLAAGGAGVAVAFAAATGDAAHVPRILAAVLIQVPAAWTLGAVTMVAVGFVPRAAVAVAWTGWMFVQLFEVIGPIAGVNFRIVEVVVPFWWLPPVLAGGQFSTAPLLMLTALAGVGVWAGTAALRRRDLTAT